ncbi:transposable element Tcb2 transposase [Trichonephila clavipes]|nr:transposable element Tcb2 transposase [Trichonephila clavipes]
MANNQSVRRHLDAFTRGRIIGKLEEGRSVTSQKKQAADSGEIARHTTQTTGRPISRFTVARRLHGGDLYARRPVRCVPLTPAHRRRRSLWCREYRNWRDNEWGRVLFTDESRFSLSSDSHRILIWRERGSRNHPSNIIKRDRYGGHGVLVWRGIMLGSRTDLHIFDAGSVNGTRYCNEILLPYVRLFRGAMGLQFLFMDDNAPCHRTVAAEQLLESEDIERMDWPAQSPHLNPIEHVWDFLGRRLAARALPPVTIRELRLALQDEWAAMPQQLIDTLILSMGRRCETCQQSGEIISPTKDRMFLAGNPSQGCFGLQSHCAPCYFFNHASFYPSDFSFSKCCLHYTCPYAIFSGNKTINRPLFYKKYLTLFGTGLLTGNGTLWKSRRKMMNPCFRYDTLKDYVPSLNEHAQVLVKRLKEETDKDFTRISRLLSHCAFDVICAASLISRGSGQVVVYVRQDGQ